MKKFTRIIAVTFLVAFGLSFGKSNAQSVLNPADSVYTYDSNNPPLNRPLAQIGKWVRTSRLPWNTNGFKAYIYKAWFSGLSFLKHITPLLLMERSTR
jgi:hypothetical protein